MACKHDKIAVEAGAVRKDEHDQVLGYWIVISAQCADCGVAFQFNGPPGNWNMPALRSPDGLSLQTPIWPFDPNTFEESGTT
jgi:hypothetical protein